MPCIVERAFAQAYNEAAELFNTDKLIECIEKAEEIVNHSTCPR
jgi:hypothetical protein